MHGMAKRDQTRHDIDGQNVECLHNGCRRVSAWMVKGGIDNADKTPTVGLEPTTTRLRALRSAD